MAPSKKPSPKRPAAASASPTRQASVKKPKPAAPAAAPAKKSATARAAEPTFKPLPEAPPRYVPPPPVRAPRPETASTASPEEEWLLAARLWFAITWRTMLVVLPSTLLLQIFLVSLFSLAGTNEPTQLQAMIILTLTLLTSVLLQVAVLRHILRKQHFRGFSLMIKSHPKER